MGSLTYSVDPDIFAAYPSFCRGVAFVSDVDNSATRNIVLQDLLAQKIGAIRNDNAISLDHPRIRAWADVYRSFNLPDAKKIQPSVANLVRRIKKDMVSLPFISPLVCISNLASLTSLVPSGLVDRDKIQGDLRLGYAEGNERFQPFGDDRVVSPTKGEIIYYDTASRMVLCRAWNSKGGKATRIDPETRSAVIDIDGLTDVIGTTEISSATTEIARFVTEQCGGKARTFLLHKDNPSISLA